MKKMQLVELVAGNLDDKAAGNIRISPPIPKLFPA
jgi:hypothetical protein